VPGEHRSQFIVRLNLVAFDSTREEGGEEGWTTSQFFFSLADWLSFKPESHDFEFVASHAPVS
jgi:hypothetical protein